MGTRSGVKVSRLADGRRGRGGNRRQPHPSARRPGHDGRRGQDRPQRDHPGQLDKRDLMFAAYTSDLSLQPLQTWHPGADRPDRPGPGPRSRLCLGARERRGRRHADLVPCKASPMTRHRMSLSRRRRRIERSNSPPTTPQTLKEKTYVLRARGNWPEAEALTRKLLAASATRQRPATQTSAASSWPRVDTQKRWTALLTAKRLQIATDDISVIGHEYRGNVARDPAV